MYTPLNPHLYIVKLGFAGGYLFFLFLLQNIDCGYSLEPPRCLHHVDIKVTEWPPIGKIAAHSAYDMFHGISA